MPRHVATPAIAGAWLTAPFWSSSAQSTAFEMRHLSCRRCCVFVGARRPSLSLCELLSGAHQPFNSKRDGTPHERTSSHDTSVRSSCSVGRRGRSSVIAPLSHSSFPSADMSCSRLPARDRKVHFSCVPAFDDTKTSKNLEFPAKRVKNVLAISKK